MEKDNDGVIAQARDLVEDYVKPEVRTLTSPDGVAAPFVLTPSGVASIPATAFDDYRLFPSRRKGTALLLSLDSFIDHANRFEHLCQSLRGGPQ